MPIKLTAQTELVNATMKLLGAIKAGAPSATGFDTLHALHAKGSKTFNGKSDGGRDGIGEFWMN